MSKDKGLQDKEVMIANTLTRSAQSLSLAEKRMIFAAIAKMGNNFGESGEVILLATEYAETFEMPLNQAYEQLKDAADNLFERYFTLAKTDRKGTMKWKVRWVESAGYDKGAGRVGIVFTQTIKPYLCGLTAEFTKYRLKQACALRSIHAWRLLEQFERWESTGVYYTTVEDFHDVMESNDSCRNNFAQLMRKVIAPAIKELSEKDGWLVDFGSGKLGRKVNNLTFKFKKNPQGNLF